MAAQVVQGVGFGGGKSRWDEAVWARLFDGECVVVAGGVQIHEHGPRVRQVCAHEVKDVEAVGV